MTVVALVDVLKNIKAIAKNRWDWDEPITFEAKNEAVGNDLVQKATLLAETVLISHNGGHNYENMSLLLEEGFDIFAVEQDSFGRTCAINVLNKGCITYG